MGESFGEDWPRIGSASRFCRFLIGERAADGHVCVKGMALIEGGGDLAWPVFAGFQSVAK